MVLRRETRAEEKVASCQSRASIGIPAAQFRICKRGAVHILKFCLRLVPLLAPKVLFQDSLNFEDGELV
jgi:hypothetical protein